MRGSQLQEPRQQSQDGETSPTHRGAGLPGGLGTLPPLLADRYALGPLLGAGANARVVRARDLALQREVAIKLFHVRGASPLVREDQFEEGRILASLNHPAVTTLFDLGTDTSSTAAAQIYLVMEYVPGPDLRERLFDGPLRYRQVCTLGEDLCDALEYLHGTGLLHRDIKPANVLLAHHRTHPRLGGKLTDFGLASPATTPHHYGVITGTAAYIAPEQALDLPATAASDVYSLGLVLLEALTATRAYPGPPEDAALDRLDRQPVIPTRIPAPLAQLLDEMTAREPDDRPTARQAAQQFRDLVTGQLPTHRFPTAAASRNQ